MGILSISPWESRLIRWIGPLTIVAGAVVFYLLARRFDDGPVPKEYWDKMLTIVGISTVPLVAACLILLRSCLHDPQSATLTAGGWLVVVATLGLFVLASCAVAICVYHVAKAAAGAFEPEDAALYFVTTTAGATLGAAATAVAVTVLNAIDS